MDAGHVALESFGSIEPGHAADRQELRADAAPLQRTEQVVESYAVTANHHQVGQLQCGAQKLHLNTGAGFDDLFMASYGRKAVGTTERGDAA